MTATFSAMLDGPQSLSCLVLDPPRIDRCDDAPWQPARDCLIEAVKQTGAKAVMISTLSETLSEAFSAPAIAAGITPLMGLEDGIAAIEALADISQSWQSEPPLDLWSFNPADGPSMMVTEDDAKKILSDNGIDVPRRIFVQDTTDLASNVTRHLYAFPWWSRAWDLPIKNRTRCCYPQYPRYRRPWRCHIIYERARWLSD